MDAADEPARGTREYPARPVVGVGAVILADADAQARAGAATIRRPAGVVLIRRRYEPLAGQWSLPGGMLETGETLGAGTAREVLEETGLLVDVGPVVEVFDRILVDPAGQVRYHYVIVDYLCAIVSGTLRASSDVTEVAMADPADLGPYAVTPKVEEVVRRALAIWQPAA